MPRKNLNEEMIVDVAIKLIEETGYREFTMRDLAARLDIKASSLYNHVYGIEEIKSAIGSRASKMLNTALAEAVNGKERDEAVKAATRTYRSFAKEHPELYATIIEMPMNDENMPFSECPYSLQPLANVIGDYNITKDALISYFRSLMSAIHGFLELELSGYFKDKRIDIEYSYNSMIDIHLDVIRALELLNN